MLDDDSTRRDAKAAYMAVYRAAHRDEIAAQRAAWSTANKERIAAQHAAYHAAHHGEITARHAAYQVANKERIADRRAVHYAANRARMIASVSAWSQANPELVRARNSRRRARELGAEVNDLTRQQWDAIKAAFGQKCAYCGLKTRGLTQDHVIPLSKGGNHTASNVVPACKSCNCKKNVGPPRTPVQTAMGL